MSLDDLRAAAFLGFLQPGDLVRDMTTDRWVEARSLGPLAATCTGWAAHEPREHPAVGNENSSD